jgi:leucyl/phenylalanyl-tRNA--protein transferase
VPRPGQDGTWITNEMVEGYVGLHRLGAAHSVEAWRDGQLVGGLYGVCIGSVFCGESMFADESDASKVVFVWAVRHLLAHGLSLVDCQVHTDHLAGLGAREITRRAFLGHLRESGHQDLAPGAWRGPA